ncbi:hypothetical protein PO367_04395 [Bacteroides ovatus]|uniref:hypothetical protein n=1 Tax=Bacteroides ovatus TaxID=28116 RepID=UPI0018983CDA|nr:hypothetical protein [Bacteroides ovatus]MDC2620304.1 hypothetical protein [Bacteroides ovatus]MDC2747321.1 hypothetical protein [Bacteroides ovatus]MDC2756966.1 hypothetical protein [Bacteroides ovatus]
MERTYVFNQDGGAASGNGLLASILPSLQNRGIDTGYLMGLLGGGNGNGGFFGNNGGFQDIIALIVIAAIFGNGNFGFGGNNNQGANEGREMIMQTLNRNGVDIASLAQAVNTSSDQILAGINSVSQAICGLGNQMGQNTNSILTAIMQGNNALTSQICNCCCDMKQLVATQGYESQLAMCNQTNTLVNTANQNTLSLRDSATANTQAIIAKLDAMQNQALQDKIASLTAEKATLTAEISQRNQNATILNAVGQQIAPLAAGLQALQSDVDGIKCKLPNTVPVQYPNIVGVNMDTYRAAAFGAYAGDAAYGRSGCGCNNYWG